MIFFFVDFFSISFSCLKSFFSFLFFFKHLRLLNFVDIFFWLLLICKIFVIIICLSHQTNEIRSVCLRYIIRYVYSKSSICVSYLFCVIDDISWLLYSSLLVEPKENIYFRFFMRIKKRNEVSMVCRDWNRNHLPLQLIF